MSATRESLLKAALALPDEDRVLLATQLMDSVSDDLPGWSADDPEFLTELERRSNDGTAGIPWESIKADLQSDTGQ